MLHTSVILSILSICVVGLISLTVEIALDVVSVNFNVGFSLLGAETRGAVVAVGLGASVANLKILEYLKLMKNKM